MDFLKEMSPGAGRLSYIYQSDHVQRVDGTQWRFADDYIESAARRVGFESHHHALSRDKNLDAVFADILAVRAQALYVSLSKWTIELRGRIVEFANRNRLPSAFNAPEDVELGGLLSYGPDIRELFRRAASYVDKVLRGANPKDLPVELPSRLELIVNRRTAKLLGLTIPQSLQVRADRFID
jgi:putative ABC transport system substrate-binding protein